MLAADMGEVSAGTPPAANVAGRSDSPTPSASTKRWLKMRSSAPQSRSGLGHRQCTSKPHLMAWRAPAASQAPTSRRQRAAPDLHGDEARPRDARPPALSQPSARHHPSPPPRAPLAPAGPGPSASGPSAPPSARSEHARSTRGVGAQGHSAEGPWGGPRGHGIGRPTQACLRAPPTPGGCSPHRRVQGVDGRPQRAGRAALAAARRHAPTPLVWVSRQASAGQSACDGKWAAQ